MIYSIILIILSIISLPGDDKSYRIVLGITFLINILISVIMLPINIRLAAQLVMQVFKYRHIVNTVATLDEDNKVMTGYYNHFRTVMCLILALVGFNVFNIICSVHFLVYMFKANWGDVVWYSWIAQGIYTGFQDSVLLFAISMLYQVACYFQGKKFRFLIIVIFTLIRFAYVTLRSFMESLLTKPQNTQEEYEVYISIYITFISLLGLGVVEFVIRFPVVFSFVRVTQRVVKNYIKQFINDINTEYLDREHYVDKIIAGKLLQIAGWGTISVCFLDLLAVILQYVILFSSAFFKAKVIYLIVISIVQVATIIPSILYSIFIIILWLYFRNKTRVKYNGYNSYDQKITKLVHEQGNGNVLTNQDAFHYTYYKHKNRIFFLTNVICVILISVIFAVFSAPLLNDRWNRVIFMKPGDYYLLNNTELKGGCPIPQIDISVNESQFNHNKAEYLNCFENIFALQLSHPNQIQYRTYNYTFSEPINHDWFIYPGISGQIWLPANSTYVVSNTDFLLRDRPKFLLKTDKPCYTSRLIVGQPYPILYTELDIIEENSCQDIQEANTADQEASINCSNTNNNTHINCTILYSGVYYCDSSQKMLVNQFGYKANESSLTLFDTFKGKEMEKFDAIIFQSSENITSYGFVCRVQVTCHFNPALRLLVPIAILLISMLSLSLCIILIHKI